MRRALQRDVATMQKIISELQHRPMSNQSYLRKWTLSLANAPRHLKLLRRADVA